MRRDLSSQFSHRRRKHMKRIGLLRTGPVLRFVLGTFREEDRLGFHDPAGSLGHFFYR